MGWDSLGALAALDTGTLNIPTTLQGVVTRKTAHFKGIWEYTLPLNSCKIPSVDEDTSCESS